MKQIIIRIAGTLLTGAFMISANAADLWTVFEQAVKNDPSYASQRFTYQADQQRIVQARAAYRPNVGISASYGRVHERQWSSNELARSQGNYATATLGLTATHNLYNRSKKSNLQTAEEEVKLSAVQLDDSRQSLALDVASRYFASLRAVDNLTVSERELAAIGRQLDLARERLEVGLGTRTDLTEARSRFKLAEVTEIESTNAIDDAMRAIEELTGTPPAELAALKDDAPLAPPTPNNLETWLQMARENSLPIRAARQSAVIAQSEIQRQRDARSPNLDLAFNENLSDASGSSQPDRVGNERENRSIALQFSMPLYQGGLFKSRTEEAVLRHKAAVKSVDVLIRATERSVRDAFLDVTSSIERVDALRQAVEASQDTVDAKQEGFDAGVNTNIDVLDAQRDLFRTQRDYLSARYDYILTTLDLSRLGGTLDSDDIERINSWLE